MTYVDAHANRHHQSLMGYISDRVRLTFQSSIVKNYMMKIYLIQRHLKSLRLSRKLQWVEHFLILHAVDC